ncbi:MAG: hypothetical protein AVO33_06255 [delta proteobacterium ML8_F1]|nr:MAG: hypothetical protein AVO33_06255 [delta proteobacterium ML8_F1]
MKKFVSFMLIAVLAIGMGTMSFAGVMTRPAEIYADLAGTSVAEAYTLKGSEGTFGDLARDGGFYEDFVAANLAGKTAIIEELVTEGTLTQEDADMILLEMANCDSEPSFIGKTYELFFGQQGEGVLKGTYGPREDALKMNRSSVAPQGPQEGTGPRR